MSELLPYSLTLSLVATVLVAKTRVDPAFVVSVVAALISGVSLWFAYRSVRIAGQAGNIDQERRHDELMPRFHLQYSFEQYDEYVRVINQGPMAYDEVAVKLPPPTREPSPIETLVAAGRSIVGPVRVGETIKLGSMEIGQSVLLVLGRSVTNLQLSESDPRAKVTAWLHFRCTNKLGVWEQLASVDIPPYEKTYPR